MVSKAFDQAFRRLIGAFKRYQDVPRSPDNVPAIGAARWNLETARVSITRERRSVESGRHAATQPLRKTAVSDDDLARLNVKAISAGMG